jgi:acetyl-CoA synthetase
MTVPSPTKSGSVIRQQAAGWHVEPNLRDYDRARREFSWDAARKRELTGLPGGGLNMAFEAVDRHALGAHADRVAARWLGRGGEHRDITYAELSRESSRFANVLAGIGIAAGSRVFSLLDRVPELDVAALGTLKARAVFSPLFSAFGPDPVGARLSIGEAAAIVTTPAYFHQKVAPAIGELHSLRYVLLVGDAGEIASIRGSFDLGALMREAGDSYTIPPTLADDPALLHFTSGTTGRPKGAVHVHGAVLAHHVTGQLALDFHDDDVFWCTADPGWVTGMSYGVISPLSNGITRVVDEGDFDAERWYRVLEAEGVTVWYTAPTAIRMLMKAGPELARSFDLSRLRLIASVGEALNPDAVRWGDDVLGLPIHDNWWQTETGGIMIANYPSMDIRPGSMGRPLPGVEAAIVHRTGERVEVAPPDEVGELALKPGWPSMFSGYLKDPERYASCFAGGWYLTGDLARRDVDGYYWFIGRSDDVIKTSGHLIGPFEVESALLEHPAVALAAVIGKPDPIAGEIVKAFVALKEGFTGDAALLQDLRGFARSRLGAAVAPKEIAFLPGIPRTKSGKLMRRVLKARELGLPEGDLSTLEQDTP